jgi:hypothetical protein
LRKALQDRVQLHLLSPSAASAVHFQTGTACTGITLKSLEPTPPDAKLFVVPQRELVDTINMRLSDDATRLLGTFVANSKKMATKIEWVRP